MMAGKPVNTGNRSDFWAFIAFVATLVIVTLMVAGWMALLILPLPIAFLAWLQVKDALRHDPRYEDAKAIFMAIIGAIAFGQMGAAALGLLIEIFPDMNVPLSSFPMNVGVPLFLVAGVWVGSRSGRCRWVWVALAAAGIFGLVRAVNRPYLKREMPLVSWTVLSAFVLGIACGVGSWAGWRRTIPACMMD